MAVTENTYTQSGSTTNYSFTFPYLKQSDVKVTVAGTALNNGTASNEWQFHNATTVKFNSAPASGSAIRIYRETTDTDLSSTFYAGSAIKSQDLNDNFTQNLYVTQEVRDDSALALSNSRSHDGDGTYTSAISQATAAVNTANAADAIADNAKLATDRLVATTSNNGATWTLAGNNTNASTDPKGVGYAVTTAETASNNATTAVNTANAADAIADTAKLATDRLVATTSNNGNSWTLAGNNTNSSTDPKGVGYAVTQSETAVSTANSATSTANAATTTANSAESTANTASTNASNAVTTANTASTNASNAVTTANTASTNASAAVTTANTASTNASSAVTTANTASTNATTAVNTANSATTTANTASTNASNAVTTANAATATANTASTNASNAVTTANAASSTASAAQAAVANAVLYTPISVVANIPSSPSNNDYVELANSTGIESFSPLAGLPSGFTGDSGLTVRLRYTTSGSTWNYQSYFANDSEDRYLGVYGKHNTAQVTYIVKVVTKTAAHRYHGTGHSSGYTIGGIESPFLTLIPGNTYRFDTSDSSNSGHTLRFFRNADGTGAWTNGVTTNNTAGQTGAYTQIEILDTTPAGLSYQCSTHSYMGNGIGTNTGAGGAGATGGGDDEIFSENDQVMTTSYSISANKNASCVGPISINNGVILTIPSTSKLLVLN